MLRPERDGTTTVVSAKATKFPVGTRIEITFGPALPRDANALDWGRVARRLAGYGTTYSGKSSPFWYDAGQFHELLTATGARPVRELVAHLDGCSGGKAGEIVAEAGLGRTLCSKVTREQAARLLQVARDNAREVPPKRLGAVGPEAVNHAYGYASGIVRLGSVAPRAEIPVVVEAWAARLEEEVATYGKTFLTVCVNRTPITGDIHAARDKRDIDVFGCGLAHTIAHAPTDQQFDIWINITTPYMPITSDGKAPDLLPFLDQITMATEKATKKARRPSAGRGASQKDVVLDNLDAVIVEVGGGGEFIFSERQIFYRLRPIVMDETGEELKIGNFKKIITDYEDGEIPGMYREPRGSIYHPHRGETITLGTLMVEDYERPAWTYNKVIYIEKEGFAEALKAVRWPERHDCMLMSSKGFSTRAARDLVDKLAEHDEPVKIFCVHDADAAGTLIFQTFQEATKARGTRKIEIINLGLEPWEAIAMGLEVETVDAGDRRKPAADYVRERDDGEYWDEWLQAHRVELNAMTTPQFIRWLDTKMEGNNKLIPPPAVLDAELNERIEKKLRDAIVERVLREANVEGQVAAAIAAIEKPDAADLATGIKDMFEEAADREWRDHIEAVADAAAAGAVS